MTCTGSPLRDRAKTTSPIGVVGRPPWSAADPLVGLLDRNYKLDGAGPGGPARTRGSAPQHTLENVKLYLRTTLEHVERLKSAAD